MDTLTEAIRKYVHAVRARDVTNQHIAVARIMIVTASGNYPPDDVTWALDRLHELTNGRDAAKIECECIERG